MFLKSILFFALLFCRTYAFADKVGQGAGLSENNIIFVYENIEKYLRFCLSSNDCVSSGSESEVLTRILDSMPEERKQSLQVIFKSHRRDGIFWVDGQIRVAKTWDAVGAPIYFNLDMLYAVNKDGITTPITLPTALSLLVHEFGHHQGVRNHDWLDRLGARVSRVLLGHVHSNGLNPERSNVEVQWIDFNSSSRAENQTQVLISDGHDLYDMTEEVGTNFQCPLIGGQPTQLVGLTLFNLSWKNLYSLTPQVVAFAKPYCQNVSSGNRNVWAPKGFGVHIGTRLDWTSDKGWRLNPKGFSVQQVTCSIEPLMCGWESVASEWMNSINLKF